MTRVLVVEDDPVLRGRVAAHLEREGYDVGAVDNVDAARRYVTANMPDLLVLDLLLTGRSGAELLGELAVRGDAPATVIMSSSAAETEVARRYGLAIVPKPFEAPALRTLSSACARLRGDR